MECGTALAVALETGLRKVEDGSTCNNLALDGVEEKNKALHHYRNLNVLSFVQDHIPPRLAEHDGIAGKCDTVAMAKSVHPQRRLIQHAIRPKPDQIILEELHKC